VLLSGHFLEVISSSDGLTAESGLFLHNIYRNYDIPLHCMRVCCGENWNHWRNKWTKALIFHVRRYSSVRIVTRWQDGRSGVRNQAEAKIISSPNSPDRLWSPPSPLFNGHWVLSHDHSGRVIIFDTYLHLASRLRMSKATPLFYLYASWHGNRNSFIYQLNIRYIF
jgi:hypothetical protein